MPLSQSVARYVPYVTLNTWLDVLRVQQNYELQLLTCLPETLSHARFFTVDAVHNSSEESCMFHLVEHVYAFGFHFWAPDR